MTDQRLLLPSPERRVRAVYSDPKATVKRISVKRTGRCVLCPASWSLTEHHLFGKSQRLTMTLCSNCHRAVHQEIEAGMVGPFGRHVFQMLAQVFPITAPLPDWSDA